MILKYRKRSEATEQAHVISWAKLNEKKYPALALLHHIPNGGSRNKLEAANLKAQGVKAGVPDLCLPVPSRRYHGLYIEMKYGRNKPTEKQKEWLSKLEENRYRTAVCYSAKEAIKTIKDYLGIMEDEGNDGSRDKRQ